MGHLESLLDDLLIMNMRMMGKMVMRKMMVVMGKMMMRTGPLWAPPVTFQGGNV